MGENETAILLKFGANLAKLRKTRNLSLRQLSALCKVDHADISRIENGKINVGVTTLVDLATALNIHPKKLLDFEINE
jgi:transcriptional regulator with XRE-family HTH domain